MIDLASLTEFSPKPSSTQPSAQHVAVGVPVPKSTRVTIFSDAEWEEFAQEWLTTRDYFRVMRFSGPGDKGLDVCGFTSDSYFDEPWDNYQCKQYAHPLYPSHIQVEIEKLIYFTFIKEFTVPRKYYFSAPRGLGTSAQKLVVSPDELKEYVRANWEPKISATIIAPLNGLLLDYFEQFDFSIFDSTSVAEMVAEHATTTFHSVRFGGGLPKRPASEKPPENPMAHESRYIQQIFRAYGDRLKRPITGADDLAERIFREDFSRQRERFYHAESLRNFARDTVEPGTFEELQEEVHHGVADVCIGDYSDALERMLDVMKQAAALSMTSNPLSSAVKTYDKQGICHQLANIDRLIWLPDEGEDKPTDDEQAV